MNPTEALVLSQVVLSFGITFALVPRCCSPAAAT
jgi:Mn2+/Fe2+ NRAMP family transporter